jgi:hypothetical protein
MATAVHGIDWDVKIVHDQKYFRYTSLRHCKRIRWARSMRNILLCMEVFTRSPLAQLRLLGGRTQCVVIAHSESKLFKDATRVAILNPLIMMTPTVRAAQA